VAMHLNDGPSILRGIQAGVMDCVNLGGSLVGFLRNASIAAAAGLRCWHGSGNDLGILDTPTYTPRRRPQLHHGI